jgi:hypothetical protein
MNSLDVSTNPSAPLPRLTSPPDRQAVVAQVKTVCTLGPAGTNCEAAAHFWFDSLNRRGNVTLYPSLETALEEGVLRMPGAALLSCIVYPDLHNLVFRNLKHVALVDAFVMPTLSMVLAAREEGPFHTVATHPAPEVLIPENIAQRRYARSNSEAGLQCARGEVDACITTITVAEKLGLKIIADYGRIPMGFAIHVPVA